MLNCKKRIVITTFSLLLGITSLANADEHWPAEPPSEPPADWGPISINFEEITYPYPVHFLELNRFGQDHAYGIYGCTTSRSS